MICVQITYDNGDTNMTQFNGTPEEAEKYFLGNWFNLGVDTDDMHRCVKVELVKDTPDNA